MTVGLLSLRAVSAYEGSVASRARLTVTQTLDTTNKYMMSRSAHIATEALTSIKLAFGNFTTDGSGIDTGSGAASAITASVEYNGTFWQVLFSASANGSIADNTILLSDYLTVSIPSGATFWVRSFIHNTAGLYHNPWQNSFLGEAIALSATSISDQTMSGTITNSGSFSYAPCAVLGMTKNPSVVIVGDSISVGFPSAQDIQDSSSSATGYNGKVGSIARSLGSIPFINIAAGGGTAANWQTRSPAKSSLLTKGSHLICGLGINDLKGGSVTSAQLITSIQAIFALADVSQKKYQATITPYDPTSTDGWATLANQTIGAGNTNRINFNTAVRALLSGTTGYFDIASAVESSLNSGLWNAPNDGTAPFALTNDGLHPLNTTATVGGYSVIQSSGVINPATLVYA